ncbi:MAG: DUF2993 domain-containing protein [Armatimonadetes bacterium]|nr:DUF2993 domain-containing protein [Armatimonadota bacterium]
MSRVTLLLSALLALALASLPLSAGAVTASDVAKRLRDRIVSQWEVQNLEVSVVPYSQAETDRGRFQSVSVRAESATRSGLALKPMWVKGTDVIFDLPKLFGPEMSVQTKYRGATEMYVVMSQQDLNEGLRMAQKVVPDLAATLQNGQITLTGTYKFVVGNKFRMAGKLTVPDGYKISFVPTSCKVNGIPIPVSGVKILLSKLNPILDLSEVVMKPRITSITIEEGKIVVK